MWPPPKVDVVPPIHEPVPGLGAATADVLLRLGSCLVMYRTDKAALAFGLFFTRSRLGVAMRAVADPGWNRFLFTDGIVALTWRETR